MAPEACPGCKKTAGRKRWECAACSGRFCRDCCKRYLLPEGGTKQVRHCNACFLKGVNWDASRTYDVYGPADGRPVLMIHGAIIGRMAMVHEARAMAEQGYRVLLVDLPGHGARFAEKLDLPSALAALEEVADKEAPGQKLLVAGFSMGGYAAAAYAAAHPERVAGAILSGCAHDTTTLFWTAVGRFADVVYAACSYKTKSGFITGTFGPYIDKDMVHESLLRAGAEYDQWGPCWRLMKACNMKALLPRVRCPVLFVVGASDLKTHEAAFLKLLGPRATHLVIKDGLHTWPYQPAVLPQYRAAANEFAKAAEWGPAGAKA
ncbi:hypothetical protein Rsub_06680 [Raphidocelis subcapitata]|uniref:Serine aminopeptidase S33 domain-containing protein n=1 Tax=Raphidocelis subcapitata TaxID=307507 RepID=A0A2V0PBU1_9CHLO|nr:hypothetical protein Rsub_06680 [Raphidocelis subcapitata]|eukprot:GBF94565.1 hypothetical protein Rsub_06680 [Raphidocelis subcapitata]